MFHSVKKIVDDHGPAIAGACAIVCLGGSLYAAFKASKKVVEAKEAFDSDMKDLEYSEAEKRAEGQEISPEEHKKAVHKIVMKRNIDYIFAYKWVGIFGISSAMLIFTSCHMSGTAIAGLAGVCKAKEKEIAEFTNKVREKIGEDKLEEIKDEIRQEHAEKNMPRDAINIDPRDVREVKQGSTEGNDKAPFDGETKMHYMMADSLIYDDETGTAFQIPKWQQRDAEGILFELYANQGESLSLADIYEIFGVKREELLEHVTKEWFAEAKHRGWNKDNPFKGFSFKPIPWHDMWIGSLTYTNEPICLR
jgi:hypothetical protein